MSRERVLVMDYAWPDLSLETQILNEAGFELISAVDDGRPAIDLVADCSAIITCWALVPAELLHAGTNLRMVARFGVGTDNIDVKEARRLGLEVTYVPDYCMEEVSDHAVGLALAWFRGIVTLDRMIRAGNWDPSAAKLRRMSALTVGVWGYGRIGRRTAEKFAALGCRVLAHDPFAPAGPGAELVDLDRLLAESDILTLHMPPSPDGPAVTSEIFAAMKPDALLVNTARGALVDNEDLIRALENGQIGGAALDVVAGEPDIPLALVESPKTILTPHVAFSSRESVVELRRRTAEDVVRVLRGEPAQNPFPG
jgi:D-3-phosphoglycerate dehydrogenase